MADHRDTLEGLLEGLEEDKQAQDTAQVDKNLADITKLIKDRDKAVEEYEAAYEGEDGLKAASEALHARAESARVHIVDELGESGQQSVGAAVDEVTAQVTRLHTAVEDAKTALAESEAQQPGLDATLATAEASLGAWRIPTASVKALQKTAGDIALNIEALTTIATHEHRQAYFLLSGRPPKAPSEEGPTYGETALSKQLKTLDGVLATQPKAIPPADLAERIRSAWTAFSEARQAAEGQRLTTEKLKSDLKDAEKVLADAEEALIDDIMTALEGWDHRASQSDA